MDDKSLVRRGNTVLEETVSTAHQDIGRKYIVAQMVPDTIEPYASQGKLVPRVVKSSHPQYQTGNRFDYGFLEVALGQGYAVAILPKDLEL
ncbi:hypothetical protein J4430_00630 [Candidatus Woesearchaeota archaeon]|nr:hypothetical protein [Candidatus Woesearchaeota archaeon]